MKVRGIDVDAQVTSTAFHMCKWATISCGGFDGLLALMSHRSRPLWSVMYCITRSSRSGVEASFPPADHQASTVGVELVTILYICCHDVSSQQSTLGCLTNKCIWGYFRVMKLTNQRIIEYWQIRTTVVYLVLRSLDIGA